MAAKYAVFGHPVAHSLSPRIHAAFGKQAGIALEYAAIDTPPEGFTDALAAFAAHGGAGANVTLPHKEAAFALCAQVSERARRAGAVNTLIRAGEGWAGDNTDGLGLVRDLTDRHSLDLRARKTLLIGAGGAARGVAPALLEAGIGELFIVNATSAGREQSQLKLPFSIVAPRALAVDLSYGEAAIPFIAWARAAGATHAIDGLGMLVEQAAESFLLWHGVRPDTRKVFAELEGKSAALQTAD